MKRAIILIFLGPLIIWGNAICQDADDMKYNLRQILSRADSVSSLNDSILSNTKYRFEQFTVFNRLEKDGSIKESDTTITLVTKMGKEELSSEIIYSSKGESESKNSESKEQEVSLSPDDPDYDFDLTGITDGSYKLSVIPKSSPPKEGQYQGTIEIDRQGYYLKSFEFVVPDPEGALKEFSIAISFEPLEGGLFVPADMRMTGFVKALLGIIKVRFSGEFRFSKYEIVE